MLLGRELPSWKQLLNKNKPVEHPAFMENRHTLLYAQSCMSIHAVLKAVRKQKMMSANLVDESKSAAGRVLTQRTDGVALWLPDYFCNETLSCFYEDWLEVYYYEVDENLDPKWESLEADLQKNPLDVMIFVHYFGVYHDIAPARAMCDNAGAVLIEDCAHVLYAPAKSPIGRTGDFVIYSQHKQLPIADGAVLQYNPEVSANDQTTLYVELQVSYRNTVEKPNDKGWYRRKMVQKITKAHRELPYFYGEHYGEEKQVHHPIQRISQWSYNILCGYSAEDYERIANQRRANLRAMNHVLVRRYPKLRVLNISREDEVPYTAAYSLADYETDEAKRAVVEDLLSRDFTVLYWPDLPVDLKFLHGHDTAVQLSRDIFVIPTIYQGLTPELIERKFGTRSEESLHESN